MKLGDDLRNNGFDTIRLAAAVLVLVSHSFPIVTGSNDGEPLYMLTRGQSTFGMLAVAAFFVISGLLISASFENSSTISSFVGKRVRRIMPALIVACLLCVLFIGPAFTSLPPASYFGQAWTFMANAVFLPHNFALPGVFETHPIGATNGSLWTLKFEVACYAAAAALLVNRYAVIAVWLLSFPLATLHDDGGVFFYVGTAAYLFRFFGAGMLLYLYRDRISLRSDWAFGAAAALGLSALTPFFLEAAATFGAYALIVFAYRCPLPRPAGDISYGTYIYAFPIQQMLVPVSLGSVALNIALALPLTLVAGLASWILVEKPALSGKRLALRWSS